MQFWREHGIRIGALSFAGGLFLVTGFCVYGERHLAAQTVPVAVSSPKLSKDGTAAFLEDRNLSMAKSNPLELLRFALERYDATIRDYTCTFSKQERIEGKLTKEQVIRVKFREKPLSVAMTWIRNPDSARRAIYVEGKWTGKNGEKMSLVQPSGVIARLFVSSVMRPIDGPDAKRSARRRIDQFGFGSMLRRIILYCDLSAKDNRLDLRYVGEDTLDGRPVYIIERRLPYTTDDGPYPDRLLIVYLDKELLLPICCISYADEGKTKLLARYVLSDFRFNVGLTDSDFSLTSK